LFQIFQSDVVVGDYVLLQPGDIVPADGVLVAGSVVVNQASLNGERNSKEKIVAPADYAPMNPEDFNDRFLVFRGSIISTPHSVQPTVLSHCPTHIWLSLVAADGEGVLFVRSVGVKTVYGGIAEALQQANDRESPLQLKLGVLADNISYLGYIGATGIAVSFLFKQFVMDNHWAWRYAPFHCRLPCLFGLRAQLLFWSQNSEIWAYITAGGAPLHDIVKSVILAIIVIVCAVPEGLPMMIAIVLSLNMKRCAIACHT
jgi:magnesium-transporting ATPase (P-type)